MNNGKIDVKSGRMELEFANFEEFTDAVSDTGKPVVIGHLNVQGENDGRPFVILSVHLSCLEKYDDELVLLTHPISVGDCYLFESDKVQSLQKQLENKKDEVRKRLTDMGFKTVYGAWKQLSN